MKPRDFKIARMASTISGLPQSIKRERAKSNGTPAKRSNAPDSVSVVSRPCNVLDTLSSRVSDFTKLNLASPTVCVVARSSISSTV